MGKRTQRSELPMLGVLFIAGGFFAGAAVAVPPVINVVGGSGSPGGTATFSVTLTANGVSVAGTQNDISFDATNIPIATRPAGKGCQIHTSQPCITEADCPDLPSPFTGKEACVDQPAGPDCSVNQAIAKLGFFSFPSAGTMSALIFALETTPSAIPDGTLYTCNVAIAPNAPEGDYALTPSNTRVGNTSKAPINEACGPSSSCDHPKGKALCCAVTTGQECDTLADCPSIVTGTPGNIHVGPPTGRQFLVCDVFPSSGNNAGQFGDGAIRNADIKAMLRSLGASVTTDLLSAMDAFPVDVPTACGGDGSIRNADVKACLKRLGGASYERTIAADSTCTSVAQ